MADDDQPVQYDTMGRIAVLKIDRPAARNALSTAVLRKLWDGLDEAEADPTIATVVITGGNELFASGADIRELRSTAPVDYLQSDRLAAWQRFARFSKPTVAAVAGYALGGGCELAMSCDFIVAAESAVFGQPEINLGILPGAGGTQRWARVCGRFRAAEIVLAGRTVDAWTAHDLGMVTEVVPAERTVDAGLALAERVARFSPVATRLSKAAVRSSEEMPLTSALEHERALLANLLSTDDHLEGIDAFLEKRRANFVGR